MNLSAGTNMATAWEESETAKRSVRGCFEKTMRF